MASVRYTLLNPSVRTLLKNSVSKLVSNSVKVNDIGAIRNSSRTQCIKLFSSRNSSLQHFTLCQSLRSQNLIEISSFARGLTPVTTSWCTFSTKPDASPDLPEKNGVKKDEKEASAEQSLSVFQRFKKTYKEHGKVLILVHCATSVVWFGSFYMAAVSGVDLVPWMENMGLSETIIKPFRSGGLGYVALAYLMYKLATPARYTVTLGGTNLAIRYLRQTGRMDPIPDGHGLRDLYKDGKDELKDRQIAFRAKRRSPKSPRQRFIRRD